MSSTHIRISQEKRSKKKNLTGRVQEIASFTFYNTQLFIEITVNYDVTVSNLIFK